MHTLPEYLFKKTYPGRGIMLGRSQNNKQAVLVYFIMGRSANSKNRVFAMTDDGFKTQAFDEGKVEDANLIIYHPLRRFGDITVITNGNQTDTIVDALQEGHCYRHALVTRTFEPDPPNYTPRISGVIKPNGDYNLSIIKSFPGEAASADELRAINETDTPCLRAFFEYAHPRAGTGHFISTYVDNGNPLPSFQGDPIEVAIHSDSAETLCDKVWQALHADYKIALYVEYSDLSSGKREIATRSIYA